MKNHEATHRNIKLFTLLLKQGLKKRLLGGPRINGSNQSILFSEDTLTKRTKTKILSFFVLC